jgi:EmrB/QacA subfamily drug resistance transporter
MTSTRTPTHTPAPVETRSPDRTVTLLFAGLMVTMLMASLNQTVLATALPTIVGEVHGVEHMAWLITAFILASTVTMPIYGKVSDVLGRKPLLLVAITLFTVGSIVGALAPDMGWLIVSRAIQGLGGGGLMVLSQAAIADVVPARERGRYMGIMGGVFAFSSVVGPLLGGWFTEGPGWRWVFWINLPLGLLAIAATVFLLHLPRRSGKGVRHDYPGMALMALATTAIVLVATWGGTTYEWSSPTIIGLAVVGIAASVGFVAVEGRASEPIIPLALFRDRNFNLTTIASLATGIAMFGAIGYIPTYLQMATGASATVAGLLMIPMMAGMLVTSVLAGRYVSHTGRYKAVPIIGAVVLAAALALLATVRLDSPTVLICSYLGLMGIGLGMTMQILVLIVQNSFPLRLVGTATAATTFFRQVGATLGSAVVGAMFSSRLTALISERVPVGDLGTGDGASSLTPELVNQLPAVLHDPVVQSYNDALIPLFLLMVPLALVAALALAFVEEKPLATVLDEDELAQATA